MPTTPEGIYYPDNSAIAHVPAEMHSMALSIDSQLVLRNMATYKWADSTARNAETGMSHGDIGVQLDTNVIYYFNGTNWIGLIPEPVPGYNITWGTTAPSGGSDGDIYLRYS